MRGLGQSNNVRGASRHQCSWSVQQLCRRIHHIGVYRPLRPAPLALSLSCPLALSHGTTLDQAAARTCALGHLAAIEHKCGGLANVKVGWGLSHASPMPRPCLTHAPPMPSPCLAYASPVSRLAPPTLQAWGKVTCYVNTGRTPGFTESPAVANGCALLP